MSANSDCPKLKDFATNNLVVCNGITANKITASNITANKITAHYILMDVYLLI